MKNFMAAPLQIVSVIIIFKHDNKYLLVKRSKHDDIFPGKWQNMGGKIELGERVEEAIQREVQEEIGITLDKNIHPIFTQSYTWKKDKNSPVRLGLIFLITEKLSAPITVCDELETFGWFSLDEIEKLDTIGPQHKGGTIGQIKRALEVI